MGPSPTNGGGAVIGSCVEQYSLDALKSRDFAFYGTVTEIDGDEVSFAVNEALSGPDVADVTLTAEGMTGTAITSAGGRNLAVGGRYLVAGDDRFVWRAASRRTTTRASLPTGRRRSPTDRAFAHVPGDRSLAVVGHAHGAEGHVRPPSSER
ncbi:hypothetical protein BH24CHL7_BH24CHL7_17140 [soil metagenome]